VKGGAGAPPPADRGRCRDRAALLGRRALEAPPKAVVPFLNERSLYQFQWGFRKQGRTLEDFLGWAKQELRPVMKRMLALCEAETFCAAGGLRLLEGRRPGQRPDPVRTGWQTEVAASPAAPAEGGWRMHRRFLPRRRRCTARRDRPAGGDRRPEGLDTARDWFEDNRYQDYLYLHGLSVEMAEAMAEYVHKRIRAELGFAAEDDRDMEKMLQPKLSRLALFSSATRPARSWRTRRRCWQLLGASGSGFRCRTSGSCILSSRPARLWC
jgi:5-methyltetrahydrofolate--homocysteine methyltransferase